jgi:cytochrome oxidase Cu insertion factor (SCO1/SenC/PrrC family)
VLSGEVEEVEDVLTRWNVARRRDPRTGDVVHPPLVYVLDRSGRIAFASTGGTQALVELLGRL